jgi:hypothetical protein
MKRYWRGAGIAALLAISACTSDDGFRDGGAFPPPAADGSWSSCAGDQCLDSLKIPAAVEHRGYASTLDGKPIEGSYILGHVEFDDQGWPQRREQMDTLLQRLDAWHDKTGQQFILVAFAHGWKSDARPTNHNLRSFQAVLEDIDRLERKRVAGAHKPPRKVVGVYVSWRGESLDSAPLDNVTFWDRKNAAERVGDRGAKELLITLNEKKKLWNGSGPDHLAGPDETQLIIIGHSFGGLLMYRATHTQVLERMLRRENGSRSPVAKSFGDFVLLVNPAFEGVAYEPIHDAARHRAAFPPSQRPVMMTVTSKTDNATGLMFPMGRGYTILQAAPHPGEREAVFNTVGHASRYTTHQLRWKDEVPACREVDGVKTITPGAPRAHDLTQLPAPSLATSDKASSPILSQGGDDYGCAEMSPRDGGVERNPYLVVEADHNIIPDHSAIDNARFVEFVHLFLAKEITWRQTDTGTGKGSRKGAE